MAKQQSETLSDGSESKLSARTGGSDTGETSLPSSEPLPSATSRPTVIVEDAAANLCYANFCRVTGTPEELILDFGLNSQPAGVPSSVEIKQRLVVNYFTAKRLLHALALSIQRHENTFGMLETDVQKRVATRRAINTVGGGS